MDYEGFARLCLDPVRLAALGEAAAGTLTPEVLMAAMGVKRREALQAIADLRLGGLIDSEDRLVRSGLRSIAVTLPRPAPASATITAGEWSSDELKILGVFFSGDRLREIPAQQAKRRIVLERIAQEFELGIRYDEKTVSEQLARYNEDYAALRRYLVDERILSRADGIYWRTGGRFPLDDSLDGERPADRVTGPRVVLATRDPRVSIVSFEGVAPDTLAAAANDERIARFMSDGFPHPYSVEDAVGWLATATKDELPRHFAVMVDGSLAGGVGCKPNRDINSGSAEIGWWLNPAWWDRGIASAAVTRLIEYCFTDLGLHRVEAGIFLTNPASARVAEKAGFVLEGIARDGYLKDGQLIDRLYYGLARSSLEDIGNTE
jgi:ribosomal-protein-alanine N-acetyltransferase